MEPAATPLRHHLIRLTAGAFLIAGILGILPIFPRMFGYDFLPSYTWMSTMRLLGRVSGIVFAVALTCGMWKSTEGTPSGSLKKALFLVFSPLFGFSVGQNIILIAPPMTAALIAGSQIEMSFTVANSDDHGTTRCRSPVEFKNLPLLYDRICGVDKPLRILMFEGKQVKVSGHGTELGLFVEGIRPATSLRNASDGGSPLHQ